MGCGLSTAPLLPGGRATSPPAPSSQCNVFTPSKSQGQGPLYGQLSYATKAGRVEKRIVYYIVGDSINDEDRHVVPGLSQPLVWTCDIRLRHPNPHFWRSLPHCWRLTPHLWGGAAALHLEVQQPLHCWGGCGAPFQEHQAPL